MKLRFLVLFVIWLGQLPASATSLPDCSVKGLDPDARKIIIPRASTNDLIRALELISHLEQKYIVQTFYFPVFSPETVTVALHIVRTNDHGSILQRTLETIAALQGAEITCLPWSPGET